VAYGGISKNEQLLEINNAPQIMIATPGRLIDYVESEQVDLNRVTYFVIDEADRMLDLGF